MDMDRLKHFEALARTLHFGRAAAEVGIDQSVLSRSIKRIEDELGFALFERSRGFVALTPAGKLFLDGSRQALDAIDRSSRMAFRRRSPRNARSSRRHGRRRDLSL